MLSTALIVNFVIMSLQNIRKCACNLHHPTWFVFGYCGEAGCIIRIVLMMKSHSILFASIAASTLALPAFMALNYSVPLFGKVHIESKTSLDPNHIKGSDMFHRKSYFYSKLGSLQPLRMVCGIVPAHFCHVDERTILDLIRLVKCLLDLVQMFIQS